MGPSETTPASSLSSSDDKEEEEDGRKTPKEGAHSTTVLVFGMAKPTPAQEYDKSLQI